LQRFIYALAILIPCFWTTRIQAGDLSSHVYNTWLAQLIRQGRAPGLEIVPQWSNVLFDWLLDAVPQRVAVALAVLVFAAGAYAFVERVSGRRAVYLMPVVAMLAYGWVFRMGFFNFYLSLGICLWAIALAWGVRRRIAWLALPLLALAWLAHMLPVMWAIGVLVYGWAASRWRWAPWAALGGIVAADVAIHMVTDGHWFSEQLKVFSGADQVYIYNDKYGWAVGGVALIFAWLMWRMVRERGWRKALESVLVQITLLSAAAIAILPSKITGQSFHAAFLADRMSLAVAICLCALAAEVQLRKIEWGAIWLVAAAFFSMSYLDERELNALEDQFDAVVATLPPGSRVVNVLSDRTLHVDAVLHMIDRACIGRCYSYANYEVGTQDFRIRARGPNPIVAPTYRSSWDMQQGRYNVRASDLPLYVINLDGAHRITARQLSEGPLRGLTLIAALPD
jgi:hypothetical protein